MIYENRQRAGQALATEIAQKNYPTPYVIGLARGGIPVAFEVAQKLQAPLDVLIVRKLGVPTHPELGFGAIAPGGTVVLNEPVMQMAEVTKKELEYVQAQETQELARRIQKYRNDADMPEVKDKTALLIDDGIATGITCQAALRYLKTFNPKKLILAAPVASPSALYYLKDEADEIICLSSPPNFNAVGEWYKDFPQTDDSEVINLLKQAKSWNN